MIGSMLPRGDREQQVTRRRQRGFTLVELLLVIAILALLIALLLPAVQSTRESARRTQCSNQLKQMALGFQSCESSMGVFPHAGCDYWPSFTGGAPDPVSTQRGSWAFQLLPYIDETNVYNSGSWNTRRALIATFFCPSRRSPVRTPDGCGSIDYRGNYEAVPTPEVAQNGAMRDCNGGFKLLTAAHFKDGPTNTFLIGEKWFPKQLLPTGSYTCEDGGFTDGTCDTVGNTTVTPRPDAFTTGSWGDTYGSPFGSAHAVGCGMAMAGGSVHFVSYDVDLAVFRSLGTRVAVRPPSSMADVPASTGDL